MRTRLLLAHQEATAVLGDIVSTPAASTHLYRLRLATGGLMPFDRLYAA